jgi:hypothetical protein
MITGTQLLLAILGVGGAVLFIYLMRRAAFRQLEANRKNARSSAGLDAAGRARPSR